MSRPPLSELDSNVRFSGATKPRGRSKSDTYQPPPGPSPEDDAIRSLTQRIVPLEFPLDQTNTANSTLSGYLADGEDIEPAIESQRAFNQRLFLTYAGIKAEEESRLYLAPDY
jgi:hypothetical protein